MLEAAQIDESLALEAATELQEASPRAAPLAADLMCAKVVFALCGSVFPHPLLLAQQLLGIEDQDFADFAAVRS